MRRGKGYIRYHYRNLSVQSRCKQELCTHSLGVPIWLELFRRCCTLPFTASGRLYRAAFSKEALRKKAVLVRGRKSFVPLEKISPIFLYLLLRLEDPIFFTHYGVVWQNFAWASYAYMRHGKFCWGGSTITMQLARSLAGDFSRTFTRKAAECAAAADLEESFNKKELLELYCNCINYGRGCFSIKDAAEEYFGVQPRQLDAAMSLTLLTVILSPARFDPKINPAAFDGRFKQTAERLESDGILPQRGAALLAAGNTLAEKDDGLMRSVFSERIDSALKNLSALDCRPLEEPDGA